MMYYADVVVVLNNYKHIYESEKSRIKRDKIRGEEDETDDDLTTIIS